MKTLFESILDIDDLDDSIENSVMQMVQVALKLSTTKISMDIKGHILYVTNNSGEDLIIYRMDGDALNRLGITQVHFKKHGIFTTATRNLTHNITISCDDEIIAKSALPNEAYDNVKFEAPIMHIQFQRNHHNFKNVKVDAPLVCIQTAPSPGTIKLKTKGFGKLLVGQFETTNCDQAVVDRATKNVALKDLLYDDMDISASFIYMGADDYEHIGGYIIADPKYKSKLEGNPAIASPIGTLKDGWLIAQTDKDEKYLINVFK